MQEDVSQAQIPGHASWWLQYPKLWQTAFIRDFLASDKPPLQQSFSRDASDRPIKFQAPESWCPKTIAFTWFAVLWGFSFSVSIPSRLLIEGQTYKDARKCFLKPKFLGMVDGLETESVFSLVWTTPLEYRDLLRFPSRSWDGERDFCRWRLLCC